uniref:LicD family protein n=1 Tax=Candidatus Kentrum sp. TUN TaxID=2126343 RepID=A0A450ZEI2_9GAMM|nr:MAG: LicD family protein [Candidatus Kentron sp. TUN]
MVSLLVRNVRAVLEKEKIPYRLDFGTLLGAVRGGDIISWDDDCDITIPRKHRDRAFRALQTILGDKRRVIRNLPVDGAHSRYQSGQV